MGIVGYYDRDWESVDLPQTFAGMIYENVEKIHQLIRAQGMKGLISLIEAAISRNMFTHEELLAFGRALCPEDFYETFRQFVDQFRGDDRKRHLWTVDRNGFYKRLSSGVEMHPDLGPSS